MKTIPLLFAIILLRDKAFAQSLDGDFESPPVPVAQFTSFNSGAAIGSWTVVAGSVSLIHRDYVEIFNGVTFPPQNGIQSIDLNGSGNTGTSSGIRQLVATIPGHTYRIGCGCNAGVWSADRAEN